MIFDGAREDWEARTRRFAKRARRWWPAPEIQAVILSLALVLAAVALGACQNTALSEEPGFSRFCATHPHEATCP